MLKITCKGLLFIFFGLFTSQSGQSTTVNPSLVGRCGHWNEAQYSVPSSDGSRWQPIFIVLEANTREEARRECARRMLEKGKPRYSFGKRVACPEICCSDPGTQEPQGCELDNESVQVGDAWVHQNSSGKGYYCSSFDSVHHLDTYELYIDFYCNPCEPNWAIF